MKALLLGIVLACTSFCSPGQPPGTADTVYICVSSSATVYHQKKTCRGLSNCTHPIKEVTEAEAKKDYGRRACKVCY